MIDSLKKPKTYFVEWYILNIQFILINLCYIFIISFISFPWSWYFNFANSYKVATLVHLLIFFQNENFKAVTTILDFSLGYIQYILYVVSLFLWFSK